MTDPFFSKSGSVGRILESFRTRCPQPSARWPAAAAILSPDLTILDQIEDHPVLAAVIGDTAKAALGQTDWQGPLKNTVLISNDPYLGGLDLSYVTVLAPVADAAVIKCFVGLCVHYSNFGQMKDDIFTHSREIMHEGVRLSALTVAVEDGNLPDVLAAYLGANVRCPEVTLGTLHAQILTAMSTPGDLDVASLRAVAEANRAEAVRLVATLSLEGETTFAFGDGSVAASLTKLDTELLLSIAAAPSATDGSNATLAAVRAGLWTGVAEATELPAWAFASAVEARIESGSRYNAVYPVAVRRSVATCRELSEAIKVALSEPSGK